MLSFSAKFAYDLIRFAAGHGGDERALIELNGLNPRHLNREDIRVPAATMARVWSRAIAQTGEPYLALRMGLGEYSAQRSTALIMANSLTVREAFEEAIRYGQLIANVMNVSMDSGNGFLSLQFELDPQWAEEDPDVTLDCLLIALLSASRSIGAMTGVHEPPERLVLQRGALRGMNILYECFDCAIEAGKSINAIVFRESVMNREVQQPNPGLRAAIKSYADEVCRSLSARESVAECVRRELVAAMPERIGQQRMAERLNMSPRTLQRRLQEEGVNYRRLVERVHMHCAHHYLTTSSRSLDEIAYLAGYSDAPGLIRAYKRYYGRSPIRGRLISE